MNSFVSPVFERTVRFVLPLMGAVTLSAAFAQGVIQVPVLAAQMKSVGTGFELDGVVQPVKQSTISAQTAGRIASLNVKAGDKVRAGQLLATIDDRETQTGVQRSQAQVAQAQAELRNAQANFDRTRDLQGKGFVSAAALDTADAQLKGGVAQVSIDFQSKLITATREKSGVVVDGSPEKVVDVIDDWTFAREVRARDPNWKLVATGASH